MQRYRFILVSAALILLSAPVFAKAKNVILFIGDGMGQDIIDVARMNRIYNHPKDPPLHLETLLNSGNFALTRVNGLNAVADSASSATAIACGAQTLPEVIGLDRKGKKCRTILEWAKGLGKQTGLVTDTRLTHATPAAFASHVPHRSYENEIVPQLLEGNVDILLGGGARHWLPKDAKFPDAMEQFGCMSEDYNMGGSSKRKDDMNYVTEAVRKGFKIICDRNELAHFAASQKKASWSPEKVLGLFANSGHPYINDIHLAGRGRLVPTVAEMTRAALAFLEKSEKGFFLMVEGGQIDWALHDNDAGTALAELLEFDEAVGLGLQFAKQHTDTLILVTADHATGGLGLSYQKTREHKSVSGHVPERVSGEIHVPLADFPDLKGDDRYSADEDFLPYERLLLLEQQKKSFDYLVEPLAKKLGKGEIALAAAVTALQKDLKRYTAFQLTDKQVARVFREEKDKQVHLYGSDCPEYAETADRFYVYRENNRRNILGKLVSPQSGAVFSTGTHIHTPVLSFAFGPVEDVSRVRGVIGNHDLYAIMKTAMEK